MFNSIIKCSRLLRGFCSAFTGRSSYGRLREESRIFENMSSLIRKERSGYRPYHERKGYNICPNMVRGIDFLRDPRLNKGLAFSLEERQILGLHGLIPPRIETQEAQVALCRKNLELYTDPLTKYIYLAALLDRNERLFYRLLSENIEEYMPIIYTPTVGLACQKFGLIFRRPRGLFISFHDRGHICDVLQNWPENDVRAIVVSDGERILGLGDLGAQGMGIPVGKLALYTALGGIKPHYCLPIILDVGTNSQELLQDDLYIGARHERVTGQAYDDFIDEFMRAVVQRYNQNTVIQFEDFGNHNAFRFLEKYRGKYCTFNDDIQGTAAVALAGLMSALRMTNTKLSEHRFLFHGAGEAALGIANLIVMALKEEGISEDDARSKVWMVDSKGLICKNRPSGGITGHKTSFAHEHEPMDNLLEIVSQLKPTVLIGASKIGRVFTPQLLRDMAAFNERPIIFALSNPTSQAECTAEEAYVNTEGRAIFASGSPFEPVVHNGKTLHPSQGNNAYVFPGVALGVISTGIHHIEDGIFLLAAKALANTVSEKDLSEGRLYPPLSNIRSCSLRIATYIAEYAYEKGIASTYPEPKDKAEFIKEQQYIYEYDDQSSIPETWEWPDLATFNPKQEVFTCCRSHPGVEIIGSENIRD